MKVKKLKHIYKKDSTINWIFRIAESKIKDDTQKQFDKYLKDIDDTKKNNDNSGGPSKHKKYAYSRTSGFVIFPSFPRNFKGNDEQMPPRDYDGWGKIILSDFVAILIIFKFIFILVCIFSIFL